MARNSGVRSHRELAAVVQDDAGDTVAVHRVFLTDAGEKISETKVERRNLRAVKRTDGPKSAGTLYLRNTGAGPLCVVEGLETGLAVYASVELDVLVLLGPISHARRLPLGRQLIFCIEEDEPGSPAAEATRARIDDPPRHMFSGAQGTGKTTVARELPSTTAVHRCSPTRRLLGPVLRFSIDLADFPYTVD